MTPRSVFSESRKRPVYASVALILVMVAMLLVAGCDYVANHDISVVKLTPNGSLSWYMVIDNGQDDTADDIIPTSDGGFVMSARLSDINHQRGRYPYLIKFSGSGNFVWNQSIYELHCDSGTLVNNKKGEIVTVSGNWVCQFNSDGELISNETSDTVNITNVIITTNDGGYIMRETTEEIKPFTKEEFIERGRSEVDWEQLCGNTTPPVNPYCGGNLTIIHTTITKIDHNDHVEWSHPLIEYGLIQLPISVIELKNNQGYIVQGINESFYVCSVRLDANGKFKSSTPYAIYNRAGHQIARPIFNNTSIIIAQTNEGDFLSAGFPSSTQFLSSYLYQKATEGNLHVTKLSSDGTLQWDFAVPNVTVNKVKKIIQASDGGYIILCENDKGQHSTR